MDGGRMYSFNGALFTGAPGYNRSTYYHGRRLAQPGLLGLMKGMDANTDLNGSSVASPGGSSGRSSPSGIDPAPNKMFVGGLSWQTSSEKLREYFGAYGTVSDVLIMKDPVTQRSRGFGFITFGDPSSVEKVISVPNHILDGKKIDPKHATPKNRGRMNRTKKIFVGGVSQETSSEEVKAYFEAFGKVDEAVMLMDNQTKRHRGFGFVTFECEDVVERVCEIHFHNIKGKKVECKKAQPKEAVQTTSLMSKQLIVQSNSRMTSHLASAQAAQMQAAAAAAAQAAAMQGYGKLVGGGASYPPLSAFRYAPYPIPTAPQNAPHAYPSVQSFAAASAAAMAASAAPNAGAGAYQNAMAQSMPTWPGAPTAMAAGPPYQSYQLANVDMSSFQGVDWTAMYGMGMYAA